LAFIVDREDVASELVIRHQRVPSDAGNLLTRGAGIEDGFQHTIGSAADLHG
jgi:hypothetical protein